MKDSKGNTVIADGVTYGASDLWLESMDWTVEGVTGS
jgi:simple sugar transport system substrate-binding protein